MLEVRSFDGTPEELSDFVVSSWKSSYAGTVAVPNWSAEYFVWQLQINRAENCPRIVAAYDGTKLAGVLMYVPNNFEVNGRSLRGAHASWLSVPPEFRRQGIGRMLKSAAMERSRENGIDFHVGYVFHGSRASIGPRFWLNSKSQAAQRNQTMGPNLGFWARALDANRLAAWSVNFSERILAQLSQPFVRKPVVATSGELVVRPFAKADAEQCVALINESTQNCDFRLLWNCESLTRHLTGFGKCLVGEQDGVIRGFVSYHSLVFSGRNDERVGIIDLVSMSRMARKPAGILIDSVLCDLHQVGAVVALKLRSGDYPNSLFCRWGWFPSAAHSHVLISWTGDQLIRSDLRRCHLLWR